MKSTIPTSNQIRLLIPALLLLLAACMNGGPPLQATKTSGASTTSATLTTTAASGVTPSPSITFIVPSSTPTFLPSPVRTTPPSKTSTATPSPSSTALTVSVNQQAHCRYGPGTAYLHAADLYPGDKASVDGRNASGTWLWIQPANLERHCWVAASVVTFQGAVNSLPVVTSKLPYSNLYGPPQNVQTARDGDQVTIAWDALPFTVDDDRGYMLQLTTCQGGQLVTQTYHTDDTSITVNDETNCAQASYGTLWGVEKHGYTQSVVIPWP